MIKRNKELETEALQELEKEDKKSKGPQTTASSLRLKKNELEKEKSDLEYAI
jgi:hypothetical protein